MLSRDDLIALEIDPDEFWEKVDKTGSCWMWTAGTTGKGYGAFSWRRRVLAAHRVAYFLTYDDVPTTLFLLHSCDTPRCVRPVHLRPGTQQQNRQDAVQRGRLCTVYKNGGNGQAKLTRPQVDELRERFESGERQCDLARSYGVSPQAVWLIVRDHRWNY